MANVLRGEIYWVYKGEWRQPVGHMMDPGAGRPAIIVSNDIGNTAGLTCEIVYLTRQPKRDCPTHCTITSSYDTSTALCEQITTIDCVQIGKYIGTCTDEEMEAVDRCMMASLGLVRKLDVEDPAPAPAAEPPEEEASLATELLATRAQLELMKSMYADLLRQTMK